MKCGIEYRITFAKTIMQRWMLSLCALLCCAATIPMAEAQQQTPPPVYELYPISYGVLPDFPVALLVAGADKAASSTANDGLAAQRTGQWRGEELSRFCAEEREFAMRLAKIISAVAKAWQFTVRVDASPIQKSRLQKWLGH